MGGGHQRGQARVVGRGRLDGLAEADGDHGVAAVEGGLGPVEGGVDADRVDQLGQRGRGGVGVELGGRLRA